MLYDIKKLRRVCVPVSIDGRAAPDETATLACYRAHRSRGGANIPADTPAEVFTGRGDRIEIGNWNKDFVCFPAQIESHQVRSAPKA